MNKKVEKIRDDLYVKKGRFGYSIVYPLKNEDGTTNKTNLKNLIITDLLKTIPTLLVIGVLLMMLLPGAYQIKEQCETAIEDCYEDSCDICSQQRFGSDLKVPYEINNIEIKGDT